MKRKRERERERAGEALTTNVDTLPIDEGRRVGYDYGQSLNNDTKNYAYDLGNMMYIVLNRTCL